MHPNLCPTTYLLVVIQISYNNFFQKRIYKTWYAFIDIKLFTLVLNKHTTEFNLIMIENSFELIIKTAMYNCMNIKVFPFRVPLEISSPIIYGLFSSTFKCFSINLINIHLFKRKYWITPTWNLYQCTPFYEFINVTSSSSSYYYVQNKNFILF